MALYALGDLTPSIHPDAYVHPDAVIIGAVTLASGSSVWPGAVLRGDSGTISIGPDSNVQDGSVIHCTAIHPTIIGARTAVGHNAHIEGAVIGDGCLVASGSVVLNGAVIENGAIVGAGAVVTYGTLIPERRMALGIPAKIRGDYQVPTNNTDTNIAKYRANSALYRADLVRIE